MSQMRNNAWHDHPVVLKGSARNNDTKGHVSACSAGGGHRWRIDEPEGGKRLLRGVCGKCGRERGDFKAATDWLTSKELIDVHFGGTRFGGTR